VRRLSGKEPTLCCARDAVVRSGAAPTNVGGPHREAPEAALAFEKMRCPLPVLFRAFLGRHFRYYRGAHGIIVVFDVTDQESFNNVKQWLHEIDRYACQNVKKLLVGNKCDLASKRAVATEVAQEFADSLGIQYLETSAKNATNVDKAFTTMASQIRKWMQTQPTPAAQTKVNIKAGQTIESKGGGGCC